MGVWYIPAASVTFGVLGFSACIETLLIVINIITPSTAGAAHLISKEVIIVVPPALSFSSDVPTAAVFVCIFSTKRGISARTKVIYVVAAPFANAAHYHGSEVVVIVS